MRLPIKLAAVTAMAAGVLMTAPVMAASAATVQHTQSAVAVTGSHEVTVPVRLAPGRHAISEKIPAAVGAQKSSAQAAPDATEGVSVRVGKNNCGGFNGNVYWGYGYIQITGTLWNDCDYYTPDTTVYLYLKFTTLGDTTNVAVGHVSVGSVKVNDYYNLVASPGEISVDACLKWNNGWGCGPAAYL
jgi:hypothetical protein